LGSSNGTYVNRRRVQDGVVNPGDEIRFDTLVFQVEAPEPPIVEDNGGEKTSFRPLVSESAPQPVASKPAAAPAAASAATPAPAASASKPRPVAPAPVEAKVDNSAAVTTKTSGNGGMIAVAAVVVVGLAVAAWFFI
jgi:pSer/pThr/pTyr-binding forkhead associated (FHA) protein